GMIGLELVVPVLLELVKRGALPLTRFIDALSTAPAKIVALDAPSLREGRLAELVLIHPERPVTIEGLASKSKNTPFWGRKYLGTVSLTIAGGLIAHRLAPSALA
ncbi:MAG: dihydroorotase, partial [Myxococcales bacterium]|nr:dihydroorotase [Myxococcales bacterium]